MTLKLILFSQEVEDFVMEILIDEEAKFHKLHQLLLEECGYEERNGQCFLICDEDWHVNQHIHLTDDGSVGSDEDLYLMEKTAVNDFLEEEGQRIAYVFNPQKKRFFLMELTENIFGKPEQEPKITRKHGKAPAQDVEQTIGSEGGQVQQCSETAEEFQDDEEGFNDDELDMEGFEINE